MELGQRPGLHRLLKHAALYTYMYTPCEEMFVDGATYALTPYQMTWNCLNYVKDPVEIGGQTRSLCLMIGMNLLNV